MNDGTDSQPRTIDRHFSDINLDWANAYVDSNQDSITITAEKYPAPGSQFSDGYLYRAHIKWDPDANWELNIPKDASDWEVAQRSTPLWETVRGEDFNYVSEPWNRRPDIADLLTLLGKKEQMILLIVFLKPINLRLHPKNKPGSIYLTSYSRNIRHYKL